ncbi:hypothetical protein V2W45_1470984 [Cenococcum geophilum]
MSPIIITKNNNNANIYLLSRIGEHNVIMACLLEGQTGTNSAAAVAIRIKLAFTSIRFSLIVGIRGGVLMHSGVVQYNFGKATPSGFKQIGFLNTPPIILLSAVAKLRANNFRGRSRLLKYASKLNSLPKFIREGAGPNVLFKADYNYVGGTICEGCSKEGAVDRQPLIKDATKRNRVSSELGSVLYFKIEAVGLINNFLYLIIRGIYNYADLYKNKR